MNTNKKNPPDQSRDAMLLWLDELFSECNHVKGDTSAEFFGGYMAGVMSFRRRIREDILARFPEKAK